MNQSFTINYCAATDRLFRSKTKCPKARFGWCTGKKPSPIFFGYDWGGK